MPEYTPEYTPDASEALDEFTSDYLSAAEWLLDEEEDRDKIIGWSKQTIAQARVDCEDFQEANEADLKIYREKTGYSGGNDFWLTRNGHGAGFWDRGLGEVGKRLTANAELYGETYAYTGDGGFLYLS